MEFDNIRRQKSEHDLDSGRAHRGQPVARIGQLARFSVGAHGISRRNVEESLQISWRWQGFEQISIMFIRQSVNILRFVVSIKRRRVKYDGLIIGLVHSSVPAL